MSRRPDRLGSLLELSQVRTQVIDSEQIGLEHGTLVLHPARPAWGPGRVLAVNGHKLTVYFRDFLHADPNAAVKMIDTVAAPLERSPVQTDRLLDNLPPFADGAFVQKTKGRVTLDQ